jgi:hypothetical protein
MYIERSAFSYGINPKYDHLLHADGAIVQGLCVLEA